MKINVAIMVAFSVFLNAENPTFDLPKVPNDQNRFLSEWELRNLDVVEKVVFDLDAEGKRRVIGYDVSGVLMFSSDDLCKEIGIASYRYDDKGRHVEFLITLDYANGIGEEYELKGIELSPRLYDEAVLFFELDRDGKGERVELRIKKNLID